MDNEKDVKADLKRKREAIEKLRAAVKPEPRRYPGIGDDSSPGQK